MKRLLIADDDQSIREMLFELLSPRFEVIQASNGKDALQIAMDQDLDLILLDVSMPRMKGTEVCSTLKGHPSKRVTPVVLLTAHGELHDKVQGLTLGADDYITKPFHPEELLARIEARLRSFRAGKESEAVRRLGNLELDPVQRVARVEGREARLTQLECDLLVYFMSRAGEVVPRKQLLGDLWPDSVVSHRTVDTHIANLRRKVSGFDHVFESIHGTGYRLHSSRS